MNWTQSLSYAFTLMGRFSMVGHLLVNSCR